jgi:hypothetical protein
MSGGHMDTARSRMRRHKGRARRLQGCYERAPGKTGAQAADRAAELLFEQASGLVAVLSGPDHVFELTNAAYRDMGGTEFS